MFKVYYTCWCMCSEYSGFLYTSICKKNNRIAIMWHTLFAECHSMHEVLLSHHTSFTSYVCMYICHLWECYFTGAYNGDQRRASTTLLATQRKQWEKTVWPLIRYRLVQGHNPHHKLCFFDCTFYQNCHKNVQAFHFSKLIPWVSVNITLRTHAQIKHNRVVHIRVVQLYLCYDMYY